MSGAALQQAADQPHTFRPLVSNHLLIHAVNLVDLTAHRFADRPHWAVGGEHPAKITVRGPHFGDGAAADKLDHHHRQLARHARRLQFLLHAHQGDPNNPDLWLAQPPEQLDDVEREEASAKAHQLFVDVGHRHHERLGIPVHFRDHDKLFEDQRFQLLACISFLGLGKGSEAPIVRPGVVQYAQDDLHLLIKLALADLADTDAIILFPHRNDPVDQLRKSVPNWELISVKVLHSFHPGTFDNSRVTRGTISHHYNGGMIKAFDEKPGLVPHAKAHGADHPRHAARAEPVLRSDKKGLSNLTILDFKKAPAPYSWTKALFRRLGERKLVNLRRNPPNHLATPFGQKQLCLAVSKPRIFLGVDQLIYVRPQRRHPIGIANIKPVRQLDEGLAVGRCNDLADGDGIGGDGDIPCAACYGLQPI